MNDDLRSLYTYHRWADESMIDSCRSLAPGQYEEPEPFEVGWPSIRSVVVPALFAAWVSWTAFGKELGKVSIIVGAQASPSQLAQAPQSQGLADDNYNYHFLESRGCYLLLGKPQKRAISVAAQISVATTKSPTCPHDEAPSVRMGKAWARPSTNTLSTRTAPLPSRKSSLRIGP